MAELLTRVKDKAIISLNDQPEIRRAFARFQMDTVPISYTRGIVGKGPDRLTVIIYSWDRASELAGFLKILAGLHSYGGFFMAGSGSDQHSRVLIQE